jgi:arylsulfatase A-like enzyme
MVMMRVGAAVMVTLVTLAQQCQPPPNPGPRPNIVFVALDDARYADLDRVADLKPDGGFDWVRDHGVRFDRMWVSNNLCCPAKTSMMTGRTTYNHGVLENGFVDLQDGVPVWLQKAGYCTAFTGGWVNGFNAASPRPAGWTYWEPLTKGHNDEYGYTIMRRNGTTWNPGVFQPDHLAAVSRSQLRDCLATASPTLVLLWPFPPHFGADPEPDYASVPAPWPNPDPTFNELDLSDKPPALQAQYPQP